MAHGSYSFHDRNVARVATPGHWGTEFTYTFKNFFHPYVAQLIAKLNTGSLRDMLDTETQATTEEFFSVYDPKNNVDPPVEEIDVSQNGPYANYNWELFFHIPLTIATHLSKSQRFAEAQRWFHYIFASSGEFVGDGERQRAVLVRNRWNLRHVESKDLC